MKINRSRRVSTSFLPRSREGVRGRKSCPEASADAGPWDSLGMGAREEGRRVYARVSHWQVALRVSMHEPISCDLSC